VITDIRHVMLEGPDKCDPGGQLIIHAAKWLDDGVLRQRHGKGLTHDEAQTDLIRQLLEYKR
jgi:hypothetical protein